MLYDVSMSPVIAPQEPLLAPCAPPLTSNVPDGGTLSSWWSAFMGPSAAEHTWAALRAMLAHSPWNGSWPVRTPKQATWLVVLLGI